MHSLILTELSELLLTRIPRIGIIKATKLQYSGLKGVVAVSEKQIKGEWPWHIGGAILGVVVGFAFMTGHPVGASTAYERVIGHILGFFAPEYVSGVRHYLMEAPPVAEWQTMFVVGIFLSGIIGRYFVTKGKGEEVPAMWTNAFGDNKRKRYLQAFVGGVFLLFGARLAGGCTSGLFISGTSQLAIAALVFITAVFISGIITAKLLYRGRG